MEIDLRKATLIHQGADSSVYRHPNFPDEVVKLYDRPEYQDNVAAIRSYRDLTGRARQALRYYQPALALKIEDRLYQAGYSVIPIKSVERMRFQEHWHPIAISEYIPGPTLTTVIRGGPIFSEELLSLQDPEEKRLLGLLSNLLVDDDALADSTRQELSAASVFLVQMLYTSGIIISEFNIKPWIDYQRRMVKLLITDIAYNIKYIQGIL